MKVLVNESFYVNLARYLKSCESRWFQVAEGGVSGFYSTVTVFHCW